ncbi:hypothetical protein K8Q98_00375, partial [Candidatus Nomurabacteria bacterium]|nr:hypothetical protein [Candidatus Nomurabacteria bacterium]
MIRRNIKRKKLLVEPDEVFLDSTNLQNFDLQQFEGRIEKAISKKTVFWLGISFVVCASVFSFRLGYLQIHKGQAYLERSEANTLDRAILFADRGIIYDRNKVELAWNEKNEENQDFPFRKYLSPGFSHVLGYIGYPAK